MDSATIYLDHNATTPLDPRVAAAMQSAACQHYANPASQHEPGRAARRALEAARERIGQLLGANTAGMDADQIVFTSGATEANNLALRGLAGAPPGQLVISEVEHPSVVGTAEFLTTCGYQVDQLPVDANGVVRAAELAGLITDQTRVVSVMLGNHETGALQPVADLAAVCSDAGVPLHTDAAQVAGKLPIDFRALGVSALTITAHKFHGPRGIGALILRHGVTLTPLLYGGFQQAGLRPGTESVELAVGLQTALELWLEERNERASRMSEFRDRFERQLAAGFPELVVHAARAPRLPHVSCVSFSGVDRQAMLLALDVAGVACSTGSACASGSSEPSPVLRAMGCDTAELNSALRFTFGAFTTSDEVDEATRRILHVLRDLRSHAKVRNSGRPTPLGTAKTL